MKPLSTIVAATPHALPYRPCVGIMLINRDGKVWTGRRCPKWLAGQSRSIWQMPQGGLNKFEHPRTAARRELREETGVTHAEFVGAIPHALSYDLPEELLGVALKGRYRGQRQWWFAMRFLGADDEIDISAKYGSKSEFDAWAWRDIDELLELIVPFKRGLYEKVVAEFRHLAVPAAGAPATPPV